MDREERIATRKFRSMLDGTREFFELSLSQMPDWLELTFLTWERNTLLNVKHSIEATGKVKRYYGFQHKIQFRESDQQMAVEQEVEPEEFMTAKAAMESILSSHDYILFASLFHHLTDGRKAKRVGEKVTLPPWDQEKVLFLDETSIKRYMEAHFQPFIFNTDYYRLKVWPLLYPFLDDGSESASYAFAAYPFLLARLNFPRVPISEWNTEEKREWEIGWQEALVPLDLARKPLSPSYTWKPKFLKHFEAAEALELTEDEKRIVFEEWNRELQATGRQYIEVPFSEEIDNEKLIRKLRGHGHSYIGQSLIGNESDSSGVGSQPVSTGSLPAEFVRQLRSNPQVHHTEITRHTGISRTRVFDIFTPAGRPGYFKSGSVLEYYGLDPASK